MKMKLCGFLAAAALVLSGCGIGYGGRVNGSGAFEPSVEWALTMFTQIGIANYCWLDFIGAPFVSCQPLLNAVDPYIDSGRLNANFQLSSCEILSPINGDGAHHVSNGRFAITLDNGYRSQWTCDVEQNRPISIDDAFANYTLGNRGILGTVSSAANLMEGIFGAYDDVSAEGEYCVLLIAGGSPKGEPSILAGIVDQYNDNELVYTGGGFLETGNLNFHSLNGKTVEKMCDSNGD